MLTVPETAALLRTFDNVLILTHVRQSTSPVWQQCEEDNGVATMQRALKPFFVYIKNRQKVLLVVYEPNL